MDSPKFKLLERTLKENGASLTRPRRVVFELLDKSEPQGMKALIKASNGKLDKASLYRTIGLFETLGIVNRINFGFKYKLELSDNFNHHHHHLTCLKCGRIINTQDDHKLEFIIAELAEKNNFKLSAHQLEIQGICGNCQSL